MYGTPSTYVLDTSCDHVRNRTIKDTVMPRARPSRATIGELPGGNEVRLIAFQRALLGCSALFIAGAVWSAGLSPNQHPRSFCGLAADLGYQSRGYKEATGGCSSPMLDVTPTPGRNGLQNNLAFYSMGDVSSPAKLDRVSLILNVNNVKEKAKAQEELARVATGVSSKLLPQVPADLREVILRAGSKSWAVGAWSVVVKTSVWPTGLGQDTYVYFRPVAN